MSLNLHCCHTTMQTWNHNTEVCVPDITIQQKFIQFSHINELLQMRYLKANNDMLFPSNFAEWKIEDDIITRFYVLGFTCYMERSIPV